jgi:predicted ATPase
MGLGDAGGGLDSVWCARSGAAEIARDHGQSLRVLQRTAQALRAEVPDGPLRIAVDDAHLLDDGSAALVLQLALNGTARVLAIVRAGASCPDAITTLWKDGHARRLDLQPLSEPETAQLLETALAGHVERATVHSLDRRSRGNPLYTTELLRGALEERLLQLDVRREVARCE